MKMEHIAFNVEHPVLMARWYVEHLGMTVKRCSTDAPHVHFLADDSGTVMIEVYGNPDVPRTDFSKLQPPEIHLAFLSDDLSGDVKRLTKAGASIVADVHKLGEDTFAMLRDPWGMPVQLVQRGNPMI